MSDTIETTTDEQVENNNEAKRKEILARLSEPFDRDDIKWKPQLVRGEGDKCKAMVVAHADPRAYIDRLNVIVGPTNWTSSYIVWTTGDKIIVEATVTILFPHGNYANRVDHTSLGEDKASDENGATSAEAQAFKRACVPFGLGRYLYDLPRFWVRYDKESKKLLEIPELPEWAVPKHKCEKCGNEITAYKHDSQEMSATAVLARAQREYNGVFCADCMIKLKKEKTAKGGQ
jgi:hypothetical protein